MRGPHPEAGHAGDDDGFTLVEMLIVIVVLGILATVVVSVPSSLTDEQRQAVEALAAASPESPRAHLGV